MLVTDVVGFGWPAGPGCRWAPPTARIVCGGQWELTDKKLTHVFLAVALVKLTPLVGEGRGCSQSD
jgi:RES domain-containing protein